MTASREMEIGIQYDKATDRLVIPGVPVRPDGEGGTIDVCVDREDILRTLDDLNRQGMSARYDHDGTAKLVLFGTIMGQGGRA